MTARHELAKRLISMVSAGEPITMDTLNELLKGYTILREADEEKSDLKKRISYYLGAKRIDGLSPRTLANYKYTLDMFSERVNKSVSKITADDIRGYISYLSEARGLRETSLQTHISVLRAFFSWLLMEERIKKNPMLKIRSLKLDKKNARQALSVEELERLRDACKGYREKALVEFLVSTGCRLSEVAQLNVADLDFNNRSVTVTGKGNKERPVYFSIRARLMLQEYIKERKGGEGLFVSSKTPYLPLKPRAIQRIIHGLSVRAGLDARVHPHLLRHTFATHALNSGMDVTAIYAAMNEDVIRHQYNKYVAN